MTIIIAHASEQHQFTVADRLLTDPDTGGVVEDESYKLFLYENHAQNYLFAVAFAGLARLNHEETTNWLMGALPAVMDLDTDLGSAISSFTSLCTQKFQSIRRVPLHRKATIFSFCGKFNLYGSDRAHIKYIPFLAIVSNCIGDKGEQISEVAPAFRTFSARLLKRSSHLTICRGDLPTASRKPKERVELYRLLRRHIPHSSKVWAAANFIKLLSKDSNKIGESVLGLAVLNSGLRAAGYDFSTPTNSLMKTIPHMVTADGNKMTNITIGFLHVDNPDDN